MGTRLNEVVEHFFHLYPWEGPTVEEIEQRIIDDVIHYIKTEGQLKPGVHQVFDLVKSKGLPMAIASSSPLSIIDAVVDTFDLRKELDDVFSAYHEPYGKPHPGVFITTSDMLQIHPRHCLVFEDSPSGVLAAKAAKMTCVAVPEPETKPHKFIQTADIIIDSLKEFDTAILEKL